MDPLTDIDWRALWIERDEKRRSPDDSAYWDSRASDFSTYYQTGEMSDYTERFIELLSLEKLKSCSNQENKEKKSVRILDVGCGNGALALPLARAGCEIVAIDFSVAMLSTLSASAEQEGITGIEQHLLSWTDDWEAVGIVPKSVDVAIASRSTMVHDLWEALERLNSVARQKVAITLATEFGPRATVRIGDIVDGVPYVPDYIYALNMLFAMGFHPELHYIESQKRDDNGDFRLVRWAFLSWEV